MLQAAESSSPFNPLNLLEQVWIRNRDNKEFNKIISLPKDQKDLNFYSYLACGWESKQFGNTGKDNEIIQALPEVHLTHFKPMCYEHYAHLRATVQALHAHIPSHTRYDKDYCAVLSYNKRWSDKTVDVRLVASNKFLNALSEAVYNLTSEENAVERQNFFKTVDEYYESSGLANQSSQKRGRGK